MNIEAVSSRNKQAAAWLQHVTPHPVQKIERLAGDASFRTYYRIFTGSSTYVLMDAPPGVEDLQSFIAIAQGFLSAGLHVPVVYAHSLEAGFLLLSDLGDRLYLQMFETEDPSRLYNKAFDALLKLQDCQEIANYQLPNYSASLYRQELNLFTDWYLLEYKEQVLSAQDTAVLSGVFDQLVEAALQQPRVCVHRDYHSRNLLLLDNDDVGIIDFQDAVLGPVTYDLVSLLRDCYIEWPVEQVRDWMLQFQKKAVKKGVLQEDAPEKFLEWCDWMSVQRHLKCLGIFARLNMRDNKPGYLRDIPCTLRYLRGVCQQYPALSALLVYLQ